MILLTTEMTASNSNHMHAGITFTIFNHCYFVFGDNGRWHILSQVRPKWASIEDNHLVRWSVVAFLSFRPLRVIINANINMTQFNRYHLLYRGKTKRPKKKMKNKRPLRLTYVSNIDVQFTNITFLCTGHYMYLYTFLY